MYTVSSKSTATDWTAVDEARTLQNIRNLLLIWQGEVPYMRTLGLSPDIQPGLIDDAEAQIITDVYRNIEDTQPDVEVIEVRVSYGEDGQPIIEVDIDIVDREVNQN